MASFLPSKLGRNEMDRRNFLKNSLALGAASMVMLPEVSSAAMPSGYASVKTYGAKGDGKTDDTSAVQKAMNANASVWFPTGTYLVGNLKLNNGQTLAGEGATSILRQKTNAQFCVSANPGNEGYADPSRNLSGISVLDLRFEGQAGKVAFDEHVHLLNLNGVSNMFIGCCQFVGYVGDGIYLGSGAYGAERHNVNVTISKCDFDGVVKNNRNGISVIDGSGITIDQCTFTRSGRPDMPGGIDLEPDSVSDAFSRMENITISNCTFRDMGAGALIAVFLRPNDKLAHPAKTITIANCKGYGSGQANQSALAITQNSWGSAANPTVNTPPLGLVVSNCYFENIYRPFVMMAAKGVRFENVSYYKSAAFAYLGSGDNTYRNMDVTFKTCSFKQVGTSTSSGVAGVRVYGNDYITFDGCTFEDCGAADGSNGLGLNFAGNCTSSHIALLNTTLSSPTGKTKYAIRVYPSHKLSASTNQQSNTVLSKVTGNDFVPRY
jgi:hypothetical protein